MLNCLNSAFKIPMGHFLIKKLNSEQKTSLVTMCLQKLDKIGATVISICCDGPPTNIALAKQLGVELDLEDLSTKINDRNNPTFFFLDPAHMIKGNDQTYK